VCYETLVNTGNRLELFVQSQLTQYVLMGIFFSVFALVGLGWYFVGIKTYGTGDYHQP